MLKLSLHALRGTLLTGLVLLLAAAAPASAVTVTSIYAGPIEASSQCNPEGTGAVPALQAAAYADFCFALRTQRTAPGGDDLRTTVIDSPRGVLAQVDRAPQCDPAAFAAATTAPARCAQDTQVGAASATIRAQVVPGVEIPLNVTGAVYDLKHTTDEVALLGIQLNPSLGGIALPKSKVTLRFTLRPAPDVGLRAVATDLPRTADSGFGLKLPIAIDTFGFRFWGSRADHPTMPVSFSRTGSWCETATTRFTATSYAGDRSALRRTYEPTGCDTLNVAHEAKVSTSERRPDVPTETTVTILPTAPADADRRAPANGDTSIVTLPPGLMLGGQAASGPGGLPLCSPEQFALESNAPAACPDGSRAASVRFVSPLQKVPFTGAAYLGTQAGPNRLPQLFIVADQGGTAVDAPRVKLLGQLTIDEQGRLVTTLRGLPDVPFDSFVLTFRGGDQAQTSTPPTCGTGTGTSVVRSASPQTPAYETAVSLTIDEDCDATAAFSPTLATTFATTAAGADGRPTFTVTRPDRSPRIARVVVHLAPGMLASLKGVPECAAAKAATGDCPPESRVGTIVDQAGVGPAPVTTPTGAVYLTERAPGAVAGLVFVSPVAFGAVDLGTLVVPARIDLRAGDLGLDLTTEIPERYLGIPLNLRSFAVTLDRPGFSRNPTTCAPLGVAADVTTIAGTTANSAVQVQMTGCDGLAFAPSLAASIPAGTKAGDSPGITTTVGTPGLQAALRKVTVTLPEGIAADTAKLARACPVADFRAGRCADAALTGTASGRLGILDEPVTGRVLLVKYPDATLPGIGLELAGRFSARIEGRVKIASSGRLTVTLDGLPDAPIDELTLTFSPGAPSALKVSSDYCAAGSSAFDFELVAQTGATVRRTVSQACGTGAVQAARSYRSTITAKLTGRRTATPRLSLRLTGPAGTSYTGVRVVLGRGLAVVPARRSTISVAGARVRVAGRRTLRVALRGAGRRTVTVGLQKGTLESSPAVRRSSSRIQIQVLLRYADGVLERRTVKVR